MATPAPDEPLAGGDCPRCGAPYAPRQEYCLECGLRLPREGVVTTLSGAWRRRIPWYPGDWIWPVVLGLLIASIATVVAVLATHRGGGTSTLVATSPGVTTTPTVTTVGTTSTPTVPTTPRTTTSTRPPKPPPPPPPPKGPIAWPAGRNGYTVVLESIPTTSGRGTALARARSAIRAGLKRVGVLDSSRYSSLHTGYYVVFSGVYGTKAQATDAASTAKGNGYADAYPAQVSS